MDDWPNEETLTRDEFSVGEPAIDRARSVSSMYQYIVASREPARHSRHAGRANSGYLEKAETSAEAQRGGESTSSAGLPFLSALQNLILQFPGALLVFLVAALAEFSNTLQEIVHVFGPIRVCGGGHDSRRELPSRYGDSGTSRGEWLFLKGAGKGSLLTKRSGRVGGEDG